MFCDSDLVTLTFYLGGTVRRLCALTSIIFMFFSNSSCSAIWLYHLQFKNKGLCVYQIQKRWKHIFLKEKSNTVCTSILNKCILRLYKMYCLYQYNCP